MENSDRHEFAKTIAVLGPAFGHTVDEAVAESYWIALRDLPLAQIKVACETAMRTLKWFPKPVELREFLAPPDAKSRALDAWPEVARAAAGNGEITDPVAAEAVRNMGGTKRLGQMEEADFHEWGRKRFETLYVDLCEQGEIRQRLGYDQPRQLDGEIGKLVGDLARSKELTK